MQKCEKCRERAATVFITRVVDKQSTQARLCEECAREQAMAEAWLAGVPLPPNAAEMTLEELLTEQLSGAPNPDFFAPEDDKWSLQKLAAYDRLHSRGEFSGDEDLDDDSDEMDDAPASEAADEPPFLGATEITPEDLRDALDTMEPGEREAVSQMLEALDEVQEHLEEMLQRHAEEGTGTDEAAATLQEFLSSHPASPHSAPLHDETDEDFDFGSGFDLDDFDPFAPESSAELEDAEIAGEMLLPTFLTPTFLGDDEGEKAAAHEFKSTPAERCPKCRTTWDRLREDGRAGCAACYEMFAEPLSETVERLQGTSQHAGKNPRAATRRQRRLELLRARRDSRLQMLRERLKAALAAEQHDEAAKLREKIKVVESTIVEPDGSAS